MIAAMVIELQRYYFSGQRFTSWSAAESFAAAGYVASNCRHCEWFGM